MKKILHYLPDEEITILHLVAQGLNEKCRNYIRQKKHKSRCVQDRYGTDKGSDDGHSPIPQPETSCELHAQPLYVQPIKNGFLLLFFTLTHIDYRYLIYAIYTNNEREMFNRLNDMFKSILQLEQ